MTSHRLNSTTARFIRSLRFKKHRQKEHSFVVEGAKNVQELLFSRYEVRMVVGTSSFLATHKSLEQYTTTVFKTDETTLATLGTFGTNKTALAVAYLPQYTISAPTKDTWGLVLDNIHDPGNLGTMVRIADWYGIPALICSPNTVDLYNPKVLHASMGSFTRIKVYYTSLATFLENSSWPIIGASVKGDSIYQTPLPLPGVIVIGNETRGISSALFPLIPKKISIPRYGLAESLNAAMAAAIVCDNWKRQNL